MAKERERLEKEKAKLAKELAAFQRYAEQWEILKQSTSGKSWRGESKTWEIQTDDGRRRKSSGTVKIIWVKTWNKRWNSYTGFRSLPKNTALHTRNISWSCLAIRVITAKSFMWQEVMVKEAFAASFYHMLLSEGKTVGLFTSPHLMDVRERFQLNGDLCSEEPVSVCLCPGKKDSRGTGSERSGLSDIFRVYFLPWVWYSLRRRRWSMLFWKQGLAADWERPTVLPIRC